MLLHFLFIPKQNKGGGGIIDGILKELKTFDEILEERVKERMNSRQ